MLKDVEEVTIQFERGTLSSNKLIKRQKNRRNFLGTRDSFFTILTKLFFLSHDSFVSRVNVKLVLFNWVRGFFRLSVSLLTEEMLAERLWSRKML